MRDGGARRGALAVMAAVAGSGFGSGRELVAFFAQTGPAAWLGILIASLVFGLLVGLTGHAAARVDADGFGTLCCRSMGRRASNIARGMYAVLLGVICVVMLRSAGEIGALTLPLERSFWWGLVLALLLAGIVALSGRHALPTLGLITVVAGLTLYGALALDARPVRVYLRGEVCPALWGSVPAALALAMLYGAMNACLAAGPAARFRSRKPGLTGLFSGTMLCAMLLCANAAIARGGEVLLAQALPTVILCARWGLAGFWLCAGFGYLCAVATLAAAMGGLIDLICPAARRC